MFLSFCSVVIVIIMLLPAAHPGGADLLPGKNGKPRIIIERVDTTPLRMPPVLEISYLETPKSVKNWYYRHNEQRGSIQRRPSSRYVTQGKYSMEVEWKVKRFGELMLLHFPKEWQGYRYFSFDIYNPQKELLFYELRIGDYYDNGHFQPAFSRFSLRKELRPGWNYERFLLRDIAVKINMKSARKIIRLRLYKSGSTVYIDNMRLER